jgi:hypothetical protein
MSKRPAPILMVTSLSQFWSAHPSALTAPAQTGTNIRVLCDGCG